ncbi:MAG: hypothetical protein OEY14_10240, partial [Myxococcales bacterium]|nr:hypothetical protein [Myxococcales bacterium]
GPIGKLMAEATYGTSADRIEDWPDTERVLFYHSILGVPAYCFPHLNGDMKAAYRRFQAASTRPWPLHIDRHFEALQDLDPVEARRATLDRSERLRVGIGAVALGISRGAIVQTEEGLQLLIEGDAKLALGVGVESVAERLLGLEAEKPALYDLLVAPLIDASRHAPESTEDRAELEVVQGTWKQECMQLELLERRDAAQMARYEELRGAVGAIGALLERE